jgi:hypothetical protein
MPIATVSVGRRTITVDARWGSEAGVWIATGKNMVVWWSKPILGKP